MKQITFDMTTYETTTAVKNKAKEVTLDLMKKFFIEELGEDYVTEIGSSEIAICLGERNGNEVCVTIKATGKDCEYRSTAKKRIEPYDRLAAGAEYDEKLTEKAEKKANSSSKTSAAAEKKKAKAERAAELDEVAEKVKAKKAEEKASETYVVKIDGEAVTEPATLAETKAESAKLKAENPDKEVKIFKVLA